MTLVKRLDHFLAQKLFRLADRMNDKTAKMKAYIARMDEEERLWPIEKLGRSLTDAQAVDQLLSRGRHIWPPRLLSSSYRRNLKETIVGWCRFSLLSS